MSAGFQPPAGLHHNKENPDKHNRRGDIHGSWSSFERVVGRLEFRGSIEQTPPESVPFSNGVDIGFPLKIPFLVGWYSTIATFQWAFWTCKRTKNAQKLAMKVCSCGEKVKNVDHLMEGKHMCDAQIWEL